MQIGLYARVSTNKGQDTGLQLAELREYAVRRGWQALEYVDEGISGAKDSRPALNRLMADARQRKLDAVAVWKLDRWGRSVSHLVNSIAELDAAGVRFISLRDNLDFSTPAGRLQFHMLAAFAEFERALIAERVKAGIARRKSKGLPVGRQRKVFDRERVSELRASGLSIREIASRMGLRRGLVHKTLHAEAARNGDGSAVREAATVSL